MKKIFIRGAMVAAFAAMAGYGVYANQEKEVELSDTMMANVEALATDEFSSSDCSAYCTPDDNCTCIVKFYYPEDDNVQHLTCDDSRAN